VHQRRRHERRVGPFVAKLAVRKTAQFFIHERDQVVERLPIARGPVDEQACHVSVRGVHHR
jgi:hypothetical protein